MFAIDVDPSVSISVWSGDVRSVLVERLCNKPRLIYVESRDYIILAVF